MSGAEWTQILQLYGTSYGALFNEEQECPEGPHLRNGVRGERPALDRGTIRGGKPADNVPKFVAETSGGLPLRPMLTRETCVWSVVSTKRWNGWHTSPKRERRQSSRLIRPRGVAPEAVRRKAGSYRSLVSCSLELRNSDTAWPDRGANMPARRRDGRRQLSRSNAAL